MAAPAFMLPRLSSPGLPSARHFEGPRQQASSSSLVQASMGLAGTSLHPDCRWIFTATHEVELPVDSHSYPVMPRP
eukprot:7783882-Alexandrium_andersonii.AAC.1